MKQPPDKHEPPELGPAGVRQPWPMATGSAGINQLPLAAVPEDRGTTLPCPDMPGAALTEETIGVVLA